ncbi:nitroreductase family deazaflavin-dependent oxidoreductase [Streptomyces sp. NPDC048659]|uniref:nitroreductase family deazaflavin-dependent oxidoreductase n=1 Tax=Streptomyces sp. NPDC048659 TaxID=3155489 RepID=UPI00342F3513
MSGTNDFNERIVAEFRANEGRVGGPFEGAVLVLLHHRGRKSGQEYVTPVVCLEDELDPNSVYVFASNGGASTSPSWYHNLVQAGRGTIERGTETYQVSVTEITGPERARIYAEQVRRAPGFGEYEAKTAGIRTIPVLQLRRA